LNNFLDGSRITFVKKVRLTNWTFGVPQKVLDWLLQMYSALWC
jgi:hypothetical protein